MGDTGDGYPNGTIYICNFSGQFSDITQVNDYTYSMTLENLYFYEEGIGGVWMIEDGIRYIVDYPYGVYGGMNFLFYSPDTPVNKLPVEFLDCWPGRFDGNPPDTLSCYGLYNEDEGIGFFTHE